MAMGVNKALAGTGSAFLADAVTKIVVRIINLKWPGFLDPDTIDAVGAVVVATLTGGAVYLTPQGGQEKTP